MKQACILVTLLCAAAVIAAAPKPCTHTVTIVDSMTYEPKSLAVRRGDTIVWVNKDVVQHTATSRDGGFDSPAIGPGQSWKYTLKKAGAFGYTCRYHPMMTGALQVK